MSLPTYHQAIKRPNILVLAAPAMDINSLVTCCRVSKEVNKNLKYLIWRDPVSIIANKFKPYSTMQKFVNNAPNVRERVRNLVTVLDLRLLLSPDLIEAYPKDYQIHEPNIPEQWYRIPLAYFPTVRFILIDRLSNLDTFHPYPETLVRPDGLSPPRPDTLLQPVQDCTINAAGEPKSMDIQPLIVTADSCWRLDSTSIAQSVLFREYIMFLDISHTAKTAEWKAMFSRLIMPNLRVLKLRGLRLTDGDIPVVIGISDKLWSLDLSENPITDSTINELLHSTIASPLMLPSLLQDADFEETYEDTPFYDLYDAALGYPPTHTVCPLRNDSSCDVMDYLHIHGQVSSLDEDYIDPRDDLIMVTGLTHLYLSGTKITSAGVTKLLHSTNRLQVLDVGTFKATRPFNSNLPVAHLLTNCAKPLCRSAGTRLETLRIHHSVVTQAPTLVIGDIRSGYSLSLLHKAETEHATAADTKLWAPFKPQDNHRISTFTLTQIPTKSYGYTINRLFEFIRECAAQETTLNAARSSSNRRSPQLLKGLRKLRLEFIPPAPEPTSLFTGNSVSGHRDADEFLAQSMGDFSFFDDPSTMSSVSRRGSMATTTAMGEIERVHTGGSGRVGLLESVKEPEVMGNAAMGGDADGNLDSAYLLDVVEELKLFRRGEGRAWGGKLELVVPRGIGGE